MQLILKILIIFVSLFSFYSRTIDCQEIDVKPHSEGRLNIQFGVSDFHIREELASPFIYRGAGITGLVQYQLRSGRAIHEFTLTAFYSSLDQHYYLFYANNGRVGLRYNYLHFLLKSRKVDLLAGGGMYSYFNVSQYAELKTDIDIRTTPYFLSHSFEIAGGIDYKMNNSGLLFLRFNLPLASNVSRTDYTTYVPDEDYHYNFQLIGKMVFGWESPMISFRTGYIFKPFKSVWFEGVYDFQYSRYDSPRVIKMYMNNFRIGVNFKL